MKKFLLFLLTLPLVLASCEGGTKEIPTAVPTEKTEAVTEPTAPTVHEAMGDAVITTPVLGRDPFVLYADGKYYMYTTGFKGYVCDSDNVSGTWSSLGTVVTAPADDAGDHWAPEVYSYGSGYYMFATYKMKSTGRRGVGVFYADEPAGPFALVSDPCVTPAEWDSIDGTLYVDEDGQPWMVFVREWVSTDDGIGRFACAKLSEDLTHFISEPVELFRADDAPWNDNPVTDGCYLYRTAGGKLLMLWSSFGAAGYTVGIAYSDSGNILGPWKQEETPLYQKSRKNGLIYDGGHGSLFYDRNGNLWMPIHAPNTPAESDRPETAILIPLKEENDRLVWDLSVRNSEKN